MLLNYGYQGILSVIDAMVDRKDIIVYDAESHACIVDGVRLHLGKRFVFPHNDVENLEKQLVRATRLAKETGRRYPSDYGRRVRNVGKYGGIEGNCSPERKI